MGRQKYLVDGAVIRKTNLFSNFEVTNDSSCMHTITVLINDNNALKTLQNLESKHFISIIENSDLDSPSLPGAALSLSEFKNWIMDAESASTVSLNQAKEKWANKRKQLQKLIR